MKYLVISLSLAILLSISGVAVAQVSVVQDSCFNMGEFVRVYFTVTNNSGGAYGVLSFILTPDPPSVSCDISGAGAVAPWVYSISTMGGSVQFLAPPYPPYYYIGSRGGFYIEMPSVDCCYNAKFYDETITLVYENNVCFSGTCSDDPPVTSEPVQWPVGSGGNGNYYEFVPAPGITHEDAVMAAATRFWQGTPGILVTVNSQAEQDFIVAEVMPEDNAWMNGSWCNYWIWEGTDEPFSYFNWCLGEPDVATPGACPPAVFILMNSSGCWNDTYDEIGISSGYIVEYDKFVIPVKSINWGAIKVLYQ